MKRTNLRLIKGTLYTTAAIGLLMMEGINSTPFFIIVHIALFALGIVNLVEGIRQFRGRTRNVVKNIS